MERQNKRYANGIRLWLAMGVFMVLVQIMLGGITRLTGSGLSITKWDIVTGTLPPLSEKDWEEAFTLYQLTPQYKLINEGMTLSHFKFIFFWEYIHRLWARSMGFVFLFPFIFFLFKKALSTSLLKRLLIVVGLAGLAAIFGWIMVASGLIKRPWVDAYKLTVHLGLGISLFIYLNYTLWKELEISSLKLSNGLKRMLSWLILLVIFQICFGGFVSGMKAALSYATWPDMNGVYLPSILLDTSHWNPDTFLLYDQSGFMPAFVQFIHRNTAYLIFIFTCIMGYRWIFVMPEKERKYAFILFGIVLVQILLGILTLLGSKGSIPVYLGAFHQIIGILLLTFLFFIRFRSIKVDQR